MKMTVKSCKAVRHRQAGITGSRLVRMELGIPDAHFGVMDANNAT
ncbi:MAG: hypothetical protein ACSHXI_21920 [Hoeflea sp.]